MISPTAFTFIVLAQLQVAISMHPNSVPVYYSKNANSSVHLYEGRQGKFLPFYTVVRFKNNECTATNGLVGTCYLRSECRSKQGVSFGSCSKGLGVCCVVTRNCGGLPTSSNNTYFRSPAYPDTYGGTSAACTISIAKNRPSVTHVRLTFTDFTVAQPNANGVCQTDKLSVIGSDNNPPEICGENAGQHMYLKFLPDNSAMQIVVATSTTTSFKRRWSILVTQHEANGSPPPGCLMYLTENSGQVRSFNYNPSPATTTPRQLASQSYAACVRTNAGYCSIEWSISGSDPFHLSGNAGAANKVSQTGDACTSDYIIIPNAVATIGNTRTDRFCGTDFRAARTTMMPFGLSVVTNGDETGDTNNFGFSLNYQQLLCQ